MDASSSVHDMRPVDPDSSVVTGGSLGDDVSALSVLLVVIIALFCWVYRQISS